jgi:hypothetical protein
LRFFPAPLIIAIEEEGGSHWVAAHGWWLADVQTNGRWIAPELRTWVMALLGFAGVSLVGWKRKQIVAV